jgi:hypothetical protein
VAQIQIKGRQKHLGYFDDPDEAHQVYLSVKYARIREVALSLPPEDYKIKEALLRYEISTGGGRVLTARVN